MGGFQAKTRKTSRNWKQQKKKIKEISTEKRGSGEMKAAAYILLKFEGRDVAKPRFWSSRKQASIWNCSGAHSGFLEAREKP